MHIHNWRQWFINYYIYWHILTALIKCMCSLFIPARSRICTWTRLSFMYNAHEVLLIKYYCMKNVCSSWKTIIWSAKHECKCVSRYWQHLTWAITVQCMSEMHLCSRQPFCHQSGICHALLPSAFTQCRVEHWWTNHSGEQASKSA